MTETDPFDLTFFNIATAPHNSTETSQEAAESILPSINSMCRQIYDSIEAAPNGRTCDEVEKILHMKHQTASARIRDLAKCQPPLIEVGRDAEDNVIRRRTSSGRSARVYFCTEI